MRVLLDVPTAAVCQISSAVFISHNRFQIVGFELRLARWGSLVASGVVGVEQEVISRRGRMGYGVWLGCS
jgi:hypothetical protein